MRPSFARLALIPALVAAPAYAAAAPAVLQGVSYDAGRKALSVPFTGAVPTYELHQLTTTRAYFDIQPARFAGRYTLHMTGGGEFSKVAMASHPDTNSVRLAFSLAHPGKPEMVWDRAHRRLLITVGAQPAGTVPVEASPEPSPEPTAAPSARPSGKPASPAPRPTATPKASPKPAPSKTPAASKAPTTIRSAYFDNARGLIVLPFTGAVPSYNLTQPEAGQVAIDFGGASLSKSGSISQQLDHHPLLRQWNVASLPGAKPATRLTMSMAASAEVGVTQDPSLGAMLVIPEPVADSTPNSGPAPRVRTRFATPVFDPRNGELTLTFAGRVPTFTILRPSSTTAYVDLPYSELIAGSMPFERVDLSPLLTFWLLAGRPQVEGQRLILHLPFGGDLRVTQDNANRHLVVKVVAAESAPPAPMPSPMATPIAEPTPELLLTPTPSQAPSATPSGTTL